MKDSDNQRTGNAVTGILGSIAGGYLACLSPIVLLVGCCVICIASNFTALLIDELRPTPPPLVRVGSYPIQDVESYATPGLVLWDLAHGCSSGFSPVSEYSDIIDALENMGFKFDSNNVGILNLDISGYSSIMLSVSCGASDSAYSREEAEVLFEYVNSGGALLLIGEHDQVESGQNLDLVAKKFGLDLSNEPYYHGVNTFDYHPIIYGVNSLDFQGAGTITITPPATAVGWHDSSVTVAVVEVGKGRVVAVGDSNFIENQFIGDNEKKFIVNTFIWVTDK